MMKANSQDAMRIAQLSKQKPSLRSAALQPITNSVDEFQVVSIGLQPRGQGRPLAQQTFVRHLNYVRAGAPVGDQEAGSD